MIFCHRSFVKFFEGNRLVFEMKFQKLHLLVTLWTLERVVTKG